MKTLITAARIFAGLLGLWLLAGCVSTSPRSRYLQEIEPASLTNLSAYLGSTNLEIRYPFHGQDTYAVASWPAQMDRLSDYQYRYAVLGFDKQPRGTRRSLTRHGARLAIRDATQWRSLVDGVFQGLMPNESGHGVLVLVQDQEIALFRDKAGSPRVERLEEKPTDIVIDHAYGQSDFTRVAIGLLETNANRLEANQTQFLFVTGEEPAFVLIDLKERMIVFLSYPLDEESQPADLPGWFPIRALNSLVIRGLIAGTLKNPVTMVGRGFWHIGTSGATALDTTSIPASGPPPPLYQGAGMDVEAFEHDLDHIVSSKRYRGHLDLLIDGEKFFPALIKSIENATRSVDVLVYIFSSDDYAVTIANLLKHRSTVAKVRVLFDSMGSLFGGAAPPQSAVPPGFKHPGDIKSYLKAGSKVKVRASANPWLTGDHRKCIIIDSKQAYVGGMNIGWHYRYEWHDMMVHLTGPIVGRLEKDYEEAWAHAGILGDFAYGWECLFGRTHPHKNDVPDEIGIRPLRTATWHTEIYHAQLEAIRRSKGYIYIENAYFSDSSILRELIRARRRGVDVRVILPEKNDSGVMQTSNLMMANEMVRNGIRVYAYPGMTHVKAAIYDGWACLGSANLEKMSLRVSQELDVAFSDPATVGKLKESLFEADFKRAREILKPEPMNWMDSFIKAFADQL